MDGIQEQELRIYDIETGNYQIQDQALTISTPRWSPDGDHLIYQRSADPSQDEVVRLRLNYADGPQVLLAGDPRGYYHPTTYLADTLMIMGAWSGGGATAAVLNPSASPPEVRDLGIRAGFVELSPDARWIAYQNEGQTGIQLLPWPEMDLRYTVDPEGGDPKWVSAYELAYWSPVTETFTGASLYRIPIFSDRANPIGERKLVITDPRFADTPGPSFALLSNGDLAYKQTPTENLGLYFRVVPGWVEEMKARVDEANR